MNLLLGIDFGTSYFKVGLFDPAGELRGLGRVAVPKETPAPNRCELPVVAFWSTLRLALRDALQQAGADARSIIGLSYASQANTFVLLDAREAPLTPFVVWSDSRVSDEAELDAARAFSATDAFAATTGFSGLTPEFAPLKCQWFQRHEPTLWRRAVRLMTLPEYFLAVLTGEKVGDASTAAFTGLYALPTGSWWPEALERFAIPSTMLSRPLRPGSACGRTLPRAQEVLGLPPGIPVAVGGLDHHVAAIGSGLEQLAGASISTGTVLAGLVLVDRITPEPGCYHGPHVDGRRFYRLAFSPDGAGALEEYQRRFAPRYELAELIRLTGEAGLKGEAAVHAHQIRAQMERICRTQRDLVAQVTGGRIPSRVIATGGGARSSAWLQLAADTLGATVVAPRNAERACLGAAAFAAVAAGLYRSLPDALTAFVHPDRVIEPRSKGEPGPAS